MLAERHSSGPYSSTYQVTNVPYFPGEQVTLSAWFDAPAGISGVAEADVFLRCYATVNSWPTPLAPPVGQSLILSAAPVWQQMSPLTIAVPAGTNYIVADVGFLNASLQDMNTGVTYPGFVDDASLTVTPEPSSLVLLLGAGAIGLLSYAWRRRKPIGRPERLSLQQAASLAITFFPTQTLLKTRRSQVNRRILLLLLAIVSPVMFGWFADVSWAQINQGSVTGLWNTGLSSSGSLLPNGTVLDPHYSLVSAPSGSSIVLVTATSVGGPPVSPYGPWLPDDNQSDWIGPSQHVASPSPLQYPSMIGNYDFQTSFFLAAASTVTITGQWSADGLGYDILLDGQSTGAFTLPGTTPYPTDSSYWTPFSITGVGVAGTNSLDFLVDQPYAPNGVAAYTGLRVEFIPAPEPSSLVLLGVGAIGLLGCAWRRRKRMNRRVLPLVLAIVSPVMFGWLADLSWAQGGPISQDQGLVTNLYNTGVSSGGIVLPNGTIGDPHYIVPVPAGTFPVVATSVGGYPIPPWLPDDSQSAWIGPGTSTGTLQSPAPTGLYDYQTTFTLSAAATVTITGEWAADGHGYDILFDSQSTGASTQPPADYSYWTPFSISGQGVAGTNTLDFLVDKNTTGTLMSGLRVEFTPAPEPSTLVLLGVGAIGLLSYAWRRRKQIGV
jgi:hypothetical protein